MFVHVAFKCKTTVHHIIINLVNIAIILNGRLVLACFAKSTVQWQTGKHQYSSSPLQRSKRMPKDEHWAEYREELACRRHDAARQRAKIRHCQENEILQLNAS